ncbi:MAG: Hsp33 family molecular chaperone HslO [Bacilli bacterium]|nr:Hsp33 family molecular chaperone HslO [Bacilli bacterium]
MPNGTIDRYLSLDGNHQLYIVDASNVMEDVSNHKDLTPIAFDALANIISLALLRSNNLKGASQTLTFQLDSVSDIKKVIATASANGDVKGYVANPKASEDIGTSMISCTADLGVKEPYHSTCLVDGTSLEEKINSFFLQSDQTVLKFSSLIDRESGRVVALLYHELPHDDDVESLFDEKKAHLALNKDELSEIAKAFYGQLPHELVSEEEVRFHCNCSKERFIELFKLLSDEELLELSQKEEPTVSTCGWCGKEYEFSPREIGEILAKRS